AHAHGIAVARGVALAPGDDVAAALEQAWTELGALVAKPIADGSSIGLLHLRAHEELAAAARDITSAGVPYLVEERLEGTELTVGVVDEGGTAIALPISEVRVVPGGSFDFDGKYLGRGTLEITPAEVPTEIAAKASEIAVAAHLALGCAGYSRTDVIATAHGVVFLETNTLPGLTRASFIPQQLAAAGRPLAGFVADQLGLGRARRDRG
ncbi:MAG: ATP-grasp domain-containing protein, partial [Deltaproteobacteria bacterium]|nr:ATP-grasp domain-containing protein [Nannocystaceae bacterium]